MPVCVQEKENNEEERKRKRKEKSRIAGFSQTLLSLEWSCSLGQTPALAAKQRRLHSRRDCPAARKLLWALGAAVPFVSFPDRSKGGRGKPGVGDTRGSGSPGEGRRGPAPLRERARGGGGRPELQGLCFNQRTTNPTCSPVSETREPRQRSGGARRIGQDRAGQGVPGATYTLIQLDLHLLLRDALLDPLAEAGVASRASASLTVLPQTTELPGAGTRCSRWPRSRHRTGTGYLCPTAGWVPIPRRSGGSCSSDHRSHGGGRVPASVHLLRSEAVHVCQFGGAGATTEPRSPRRSASFPWAAVHSAPQVWRRHSPTPRVQGQPVCRCRNSGRFV